MKFTIVIPHFRTLKMTAFTVAQFLKCKGNHEVEIVVIDNSYPDESIKGLEPFIDEILILHNTSDKLSSHGIAIDFATNLISNEWIIAAESDSYPTNEKWLDYYEDLINKGYDGAGSLLSLSGGTYLHPAGMLFRKSNWRDAYSFCIKTPYFYYPNMSMKEGFSCHTMVHKDVISDFLKNPEDYIELSEGYKPYTLSKAELKRYYYYSTVGPMHNGMGGNQESIHTYGQRNRDSEVPTILLEKSPKIIKRIGYEPGQFFYYWQLSKGKKLFEIPTDVHWLPGKENQQQERTVMENGLTHLWGISAYHGVTLNDEDVAKVKQSIPEQLYNSLPKHLKIKL